jgi:hypothetical protein
MVGLPWKMKILLPFMLWIIGNTVLGITAADAEWDP